MLQDLLRTSLDTSVLTRDQVNDIEQVVCAPSDKAHAHLEQLGAALRKTKGDQITEAAKLAFSALANDLADNFLMVALVSGRPGERRILKFDYEDEARSSRQPTAVWSAKSSWGRLAARVKDWPPLIAAQIGLAPLPIVLGIRDVAYATSYHIELHHRTAFIFFVPVSTNTRRGSGSHLPIQGRASELISTYITSLETSEHGSLLSSACNRATGRHWA